MTSVCVCGCAMLCSRNKCQFESTIDLFPGFAEGVMLILPSNLAVGLIGWCGFLHPDDVFRCGAKHTPYSRQHVTMVKVKSNRPVVPW